MWVDDGPTGSRSCMYSVKGQGRSGRENGEVGGPECSGQEGVWRGRELDPGGGWGCQGALGEKNKLYSSPRPRRQINASLPLHTLGSRGCASDRLTPHRSSPSGTRVLPAGARPPRDGS